MSLVLVVVTIVIVVVAALPTCSYGQLPAQTPAEAVAAAQALVARRLGANAVERIRFVKLNNADCAAAIPQDTTTGGDAVRHQESRGSLGVNSTLPCFSLQTHATQALPVLTVGGSSSVEMAMGLNHYLRQYLNMSFSWNRTGGNNIGPLPVDLPAINAPRLFVKRAQYSYYQNVVTASYSMVWWDWERWQEEIDWMALNGVNLALAYTGQEYVYRKVFLALDVPTSALKTFFDGPAFLAWSRGQGKSGLGGPLPLGWFEQQWNLQKKIVARQTELGIGSILPAFQGNVPPIMETLYPHANISNGWLDALDPLFPKIAKMVLSELINDFGPTHFYQADGFFNHATGPWVDSATATIAANSTATTRSNSGGTAHIKSSSRCTFSETQLNDTFFYTCVNSPCQQFSSLDAAQQQCLLEDTCMGVTMTPQNGTGDAATYTMRTKATAYPSPTNEVSWAINNTWSCRPIESDSGAALRARTVFDTLTSADPDAVWIYQGWIWLDLDTLDGFGYVKGFLSEIPPDRLIILDMEAEYAEIWRWTDSFLGTQFVWASMDNFGGNNGMYGDIQLVFDRTQRVIEESASLAGIGITMEGIDQNPAYYQAVLDTAWFENMEVASFLAGWGRARCNCSSSNDAIIAQQAYQQLAETVYSKGQLHSLHHVYPTQMLPVIGIRTLWEGTGDPASLRKAWGMLNGVAERAQRRENSALFFDLVDIGKEYLSLGPAMCYYQRMLTAFNARNASGVVAAGTLLLEVADDIDELLATQDPLTLGSWLVLATKLGAKMNATEQFVWNALSQVTLWNPYEPHTVLSQVPIHTDYAIKLWGGLQKAYHTKRLEMFINHAATDFSAGRPFNVTRYTTDILSFSVAFENGGIQVPTTPQGNTVDVSVNLFKKYTTFSC